MDEDAVLERVQMLRSVWPEEYRLVGEDTLTSLALGPAEFGLPEGGPHFNMMPVLQSMAASLSIFASLLTITRMLYKTKGKDITTREIVMIFNPEKAALPHEIDPEKLEKIVEFAVKVVGRKPF